MNVLLHVRTFLSGYESDIWPPRYVFVLQLFSLMDSKPPISRAKMISITKSAIKAIKVRITASKYESVRINLKSFNAAIKYALTKFADVYKHLMHFCLL